MIRLGRGGRCLLCVDVGAWAAAPMRTFVATTGNDANPCTLAAPCREFQAAINRGLLVDMNVLRTEAGAGLRDRMTACVFAS